MKYFILIILIVFYLKPVFSQSTGIEVNFGAGNYYMNGLKDLNSYVQDELPFNTELTSDFPVYLYYKASAFKQINKFDLGVSFSFHTTGSRVSAKDYSGEYRFDNIVKGYMPGVFIQSNLTNFQNVNLDYHVELGIIASNLQSSEYFKLSDTVYINSNASYKALNAFVEPGLKLNYPVYSINFGVYIGYMLQFGKYGFYIDNMKTSQIVNPDTGTAIKPGWNGLRMSVFVSYRFKRTISENNHTQ